MEFLKLEDRVKKWIENNKSKWILLLLTLGVSLGLLESYLLGMDSTTTFLICSSYSFVLICCELLIGGSGTI